MCGIFGYVTDKDINLGETRSIPKLLQLPKTANPAHMKNNAAVDFVISDEDMDFLKNMEQIEDYGSASMFPVFGGKLG